MIGNNLWAVGVEVRAEQLPDGQAAWGASARLHDEPSALDDPDNGKISVTGAFGTQRCVESTATTDGLTAAIDAVRDAAERMSVVFESPYGAPMILRAGDGDAWLPEDWPERFAGQARRLGWMTLDDVHQP